MMSENMKLWDAVCKTNPAHAKKVNQRGGFTAIDAHYQVQSATEAFGPVGIGWGYDCEYLFQGSLVICLVTMWHGKRENSFGPIAGSAELVSAKGRTDSDAPKKAMTDGITKALSHIGFNSDVFLGKFDDNKYVQEMQAEFAEPVGFQVDEMAQSWIDAARHNIHVLDELEDGPYKEFIKEQLK